MKRLTILVLTALLLAVPSPGYPEKHATEAESPKIEEPLPEYAYLERPESEISIAEGALLIAKGLYPDIDVKHYLECIETWVEDIKSELDGDEEPEEILSVINTYIYDTLGFEYEYDKETYVSLHLNTVIDRKKGNCRGLATLYLALTEGLGLPVFGLDVPGHTLVRYDDGETRFNIEPTARGIFRSDEKIKRIYSVAPEAIRNGAFMRSLGKKELLGKILVTRASNLRKSGQPEQALRDLAEAERHISNSPFLYDTRGTVYDNQKNYGLAIEQYTIAITLNPNVASLLAKRARIYQEQGDDEKAIHDYSRACSLRPDKASVFAARGIAFYNNCERTKAEEDLLRAAELESENPKVYRMLGSFSYTNGDYEAAIQHYSRAISLDPEFAETYLFRGKVHKKTGKAIQACLDFSRTIVLEPDNLKAYRNRAIVFHNRGQMKRAIEDNMKALEIKPDDAAALYNLGMVYETLGETTEMVDCLNRYLLHAPDDEPEDNLQKARELIKNSK